MKKIAILVILVVFIGGCKNTSETDSIEAELVVEYESIIDELEKKIETLEGEVDNLYSSLLVREQELERLNEENLALIQDDEEGGRLEENQEYDALIYDLESYYNKIQVREDIPSPEYTLDELTEIYESVEDGVDLNTYGAYVAQIYFEVGIENFIQQVAAIDDQKDRNLIAVVFVNNLISFPDVYYANEIPIEALQDSLERQFFNQLDEFMPDKEREVIYTVIHEIWATHNWFVD